MAILPHIIVVVVVGKINLDHYDVSNGGYRDDCGQPNHRLYGQELAISSEKWRRQCVRQQHKHFHQKPFNNI